MNVKIRRQISLHNLHALENIFKGDFSLRSISSKLQFRPVQLSELIMSWIQFIIGILRYNHLHPFYRASDSYIT